MGKGAKEGVGVNLSGAEMIRERENRQEVIVYIGNGRGLE